MKTGTTSRTLGVVFGLAALIAGSWWERAVPPPVTANQTLAMLPPGSSIHSLARLDLDGRPPLEAAVVARIPTYPGSREITYTAILLRYDRWRRAYREIYRARVAGTVPFSVDAARLLGERDAAVFSGLNDDGSRSYEVIGLTSGHPTIIREGRGNGSILPEIPASVTWRYVVRSGVVIARTPTVRVRPHQVLRILASGGGAASVVLPDQRLDVVENGYRARLPGTYTIRITTGFTPPDQSYALTVIVE